MSDFIPLDPLVFLQARDLQSQTAHRAALTRQADTQSMLLQEREAKLKQFNAEQQKATAPAPPVPGADYPDAGAELGGPPTGAAAAPVPMWQQQMDLANIERKNAALALKLGLVPEADKFSDNARQYMADARLAKKDADDEQTKGLDRAIQMATAAKSPMMYEVIKNMAKEEARRTGTEDVWSKLGLPDQWEPGVEKKLDAIANASMAVKDRIAAEQKTMELAETKRLHDADIVHKERTAAQGNQRISLARQGLKLKEDENDIRRAERKDAVAARKVEQDDKHTESIVKDLNSTLQRNTVIKNYDKYEQGRQLALNMKRDMAAAGSRVYVDAITAPMTDALKHAYINMAGDYRARAGTNMSEKNVAAFNGLMQKAEKWLGSLGGATPPLSRKAAEEVIGAIEKMSAIATAQAFKDEALAVEGAAKRDRTGRAPSRLNLRAFGMENLVYLADQGLLEVKETKTIDGRKWPTKVQVDGKTINVAPPSE